MTTWLAVGVGGALGSAARHAVNRLVHRTWPNMTFSLGTMVVNVSGCVVIGLLAGLVMVGLWPGRFQMREFVFVGLLGGFTTFSTFGLDTITLWRTSGAPWALVNVAGQTIFGLIGVYAGLKAAEWVTHGNI